MSNYTKFLFQSRDLKGHIDLPNFFCSSEKQRNLSICKASVPSESYRKVLLQLRKINVSPNLGLPFHYFQCMLHPLDQNWNETYVYFSGRIFGLFLLGTQNTNILSSNAQRHDLPISQLTVKKLFLRHSVCQPPRPYCFQFSLNHIGFVKFFFFWQLMSSSIPGEFHVCVGTVLFLRYKFFSLQKKRNS